VHPAQLLLLLDELAQQGGAGAAAVDVEAEAAVDEALRREIEDAEAHAEATRGSASPRRPRRQSWQARGVERRVHEIAVPVDERRCTACGEAQRPIGVDISRVLKYVPAHFVEHEYHRQKYACSVCKQGVTTAPAPPKVIERGIADASLLAHVVVSKFADHCPLHRLARQYARSGVDVPVSTLGDWVAETADRLAPLVERLAERVVTATVTRVDGTGIKVLDPTAPDHIVNAVLWCYVGDDRDVLIRAAPTGEGARGPWHELAGRRGYVQADAALVFDRLFNGKVASAIEVGCLSHARRRLVALKDTDCRAAYPLTLIARLYRLEHLADAQGLTGAARARFRQERSRPVLDQLRAHLITLVAHEPPSSELAKAGSYFINHWTALTRFVEDGDLDLDNNLCERQIRDIALGRKNFLFAGSHAAADRAATLYSLLRTCAQHDVPPLPYLTDVLRRLASGWPEDRLDELLPDHWQASRSPP
jgi:transposase